MVLEGEILKKRCRVSHGHRDEVWKKTVLLELSKKGYRRNNMTRLAVTDYGWKELNNLLNLLGACWNSEGTSGDIGVAESACMDIWGILRAAMDELEKTGDCPPRFSKMVSTPLSDSGSPDSHTEPD